MRRFLLLLVLATGFAVPAFALGEGSPSPAAVAACQAEAAQLGKDAFVAKYGPTEPYGHCYAAHAETPTTTTAATTTTATTGTTPDSPAAAACKAEYLQIGADAFVAKYGAAEAYGHCLTAHTTATTTTSTTTTTTETKPKPPAASAEKLAQAACLAEGRKLGRDVFTAKYGVKEPFGQCVKAALAKFRRR